MERPRFHLSIPVRDVGLAADWYVRVLGCQPGRWGGKASILELDGHLLVLQQRSESHEAFHEEICSHHFGLVFESRLGWERLRVRVAQCGEEIEVEPKCCHPKERIKHWCFFLRDPSNNLLEFRLCNDDKAMLSGEKPGEQGYRDPCSFEFDRPTTPADADRFMVQQPEPAWIGTVFGTTITALEAKLLGEARGFQSTTWRLKLNPEPPDSAPACVVLKSEASNLELNAFSRLNNAFEREIGVYTCFMPRLQNHRPHVYASQQYSPSWILMEDLSCLRSGDQVVGLSHAETIATIKSIAAIHAEFWMDPSVEQHSWLPRDGFWFADPKNEIADDFFAVYGVRFGPVVCRLYQAVLEQSIAIDEALNDRPWTLVHGDLRADNVLFANTMQNPDAVILDWSWACRSLAMIDLAFLVGGSTPHAQRHGRHEELLQVWHHALLKSGVNDYTLYEARRDQQLAALRCITAGIAMHSFSKGCHTPVRAALYMDDAIQRHASYAAEIQAWEALPDPSGFLNY